MNPEQKKLAKQFYNQNVEQSRSVILMTMSEKGEIQIMCSGEHLDFVFLHKVADIHIAKIIQGALPGIPIYQSPSQPNSSAH